MLGIRYHQALGDGKCKEPKMSKICTFEDFETKQVNIVYRLIYIPKLGIHFYYIYEQ